VAGFAQFPMAVFSGGGRAAAADYCEHGSPTGMRAAELTIDCHLNTQDGTARGFSR
jgi:hypothetical protein